MAKNTGITVALFQAAPKFFAINQKLWRTMIYPLFNALLILLYFENSESYHQKMLKLWRQTFKRFMMIPKSTNSDLVDEMIGIDLIELIVRNVQNSARKWDARCERKDPQLLKKKETKDYLKGIPKEWCMILKQQCSLCPICKNSTRNEHHMETKHGIEIIPYKEIWKAIKKLRNKKKKVKLCMLKEKYF